MISTPTRYRKKVTSRENPQTAVPVTVVTGNTLPIAQRARMCAHPQRVDSEALPPLPHCDCRTLYKRHLITTMTVENYIDDCRIVLETPEIGRRNPRRVAR